MSTLTPELAGITSMHQFAGLKQVSQELVPGDPSGIRDLSPLPFSLHCLGGVWDGYLVGGHKNNMLLRLTGFPPIELSQIIELEYGISGQDLPLKKFHGMIKDIQVEPGQTAWEGTTNILLDCPTENDAMGSFSSGTRVLLPEEESLMVQGHVLNGSFNSSWKMLNHELSDAISIVSFREKEKEVKGGSLILQKTGVSSSRLTIKKGNGQRISAYHDQPIEGNSTERPVVVIAPGYGETKRDYLTLAYYFASNGFQVVRYDHTNHVGESDGLHYQVSLSSMKNDFQTVTRYVKATWPHSAIIGVAASLASRVALRAEAECPSLSLLIMLMSIVNVQRSAATVHQEDLFAAYGNEQCPASANFLGFNVGNQFLGDAIANKFVTLEHTLFDAKSLTSPVILVSAEKDAWVAPDDLQAFRNALDRHLEHWMVVPDALHRLQENPKRARETYQRLIARCHEQVNQKAKPDVIHTPNRLDLGRQNRREKSAQQQQAETDVGTGFWQDYLGHFQSVAQCRDYVKLLDHVFHVLGPITPGQRFLDAGCGNGNAGLYFLNRLSSTISTGIPFLEKYIQYVGIDVVPDALKRANNAMRAATTNCQHGMTSPTPFVSKAWAHVDLGQPLPFPDNRFDRIVSNLVIGYVQDPGATLRELYRILAPGGRIVISNLKPNGDFSGIYQSLVSSAVLPQQREEARDLLNNYGKIRQAEKEGQFCFYDQTQWESIIATLGCTNAGIFSTFAGQAYLVVLDKPIVCTPAQKPIIQNAEPCSIRNQLPEILKQVA
ncbi:methyltransferase domain-containing protein [Candidatus Nitrospira allomarina]|uniref:Methyltransferase domain-containing protein n=1 Tax=Candidatus Nitrospira allomarina TaxID=3020900 RepID=A0AA96G865_9BACT|nr:methyltransferase domain-containing protein [Candidatus Nitrospira allomarina]WNM57189.1 methyltransferase domain-containing protein [Candidatus Nitrospira allomarina]